jgi:NAD(P)-dependent dehydrogenase (short-subunit alcohol dehydrogenase family)
MKAPIPDISRDLFDLTGYCTIVTGASVGIGLSIAEALAYRGSDLVLVSRNAQRLEEAARKVRAIGRRVVALAADVADDDAPQRIVEAALGLGGRIDVLVNNAGFMTFADPFNVDDKTWDQIFDVNVRAPMRITRAVLAEMVKASRGSIINIGSSWSTRASVFNQDGGGVDYCSSKAALHALTRATAQDVAPKNIRVNTIAPGAVDTPDACRPSCAPLRVREIHSTRQDPGRGGPRRGCHLPCLRGQRLHHRPDPPCQWRVIDGRLAKILPGITEWQRAER